MSISISVKVTRICCFFKAAQPTELNAPRKVSLDRVKLDGDSGLPTPEATDTCDRSQGLKKATVVYPD